MGEPDDNLQFNIEPFPLSRNVGYSDLTIYGCTRLTGSPELSYSQLETSDNIVYVAVVTLLLIFVRDSHGYPYLDHCPESVQPKCIVMLQNIRGKEYFPDGKSVYLSNFVIVASAFGTSLQLPKEVLSKHV